MVGFARPFELVLLEHELILGRSVPRELSEALRLKIKLPARDVTAIITFLSEEATELVESSDPVTAAVDRDDAIVLGDAVISHAKVFVTGDAGTILVSRSGRARAQSRCELRNG
jgi:predicted nucleic acid-binding protein